MRLRSTRLTAIANAIRDKFYGAALNMRFDNTTSLDPRVNFNRTTNATLTNSAGLIANAPMNLLTFSEQFDNAAWVKLNTTITANAVTAPDGATTADKLVETATTAQHITYRTVATANTAHTFSVYAKAAERSWVFLQCDGPASGRYFDLVNGATGSNTGATNTASITPVGDGWYRCSISLAVNAGSPGFYTVLATGNGTNNYAGDGTSGIYIWGAQLEVGSTATSYNPTTVKNLLGFTEHFDNAAWTKSNSFVQTNLLTYSEQFDNAAWGKSGTSTIAAGTYGQIFRCGATATSQLTSGSFSVSAGASVAQSVFAHPEVSSFVILTLVDLTSGALQRSWFNLLTGQVGSTASGGATVTSPVASISGPDANGRYRCTLAATFTNATTTRFALNISNSNSVFDGDALSGVYIWGAQLVQGTTPGDYKATYATAAAVGYTDIYGQPFAQKLVENTATSTHNITVSAIVLNARLCLSAYVKASERMFALLGNPEHAISVNLSTGTATSAVGSPSAISCTDAGNGWFRIGFSAVFTSNGGFNIYTSSNGVWDSRSYTGDGASGIYIFGAQLSDSASVDPYVYQPVAAPTSTAYYGPRFDYDPVTLAPKGLLIEEQRTNLITYSEQFDNAAWAGTGIVVTANSVISPSGTTTADTLNEGTANSLHQLQQSGFTYTSGVSYTQSVYAKADTATVVQMLFVSTAFGANAFANYNLATGVLGTVGSSATATITDVGNGWYRLTLTAPATLTVAGTFGAFIFLCNNDANAARAGGYTGTNKQLYVWGAQLEVGAKATSYIPTAASQVTRAADSASMIGNNFARWYNVNEGTLYSQYINYTTVTGSLFSMDDGTINNRIIQFTNVGTLPYFRVVSGGTDQANFIVGTIPVGVSAKFAGAYQVNDFAASVNGASVATDTSGNIPTGLTTARIGQNVLSGAYLNGTISRIAYYNRRLANTELQALTR